MRKISRIVIFFSISGLALGAFLSVAKADVQCPFSSGTCVQLSPQSVSSSTAAITIAANGNSTGPIYFYLLDPAHNVIKQADIFPAARNQTYSFADLGFPAALPESGTYTVFAGSNNVAPPPLPHFNSLASWFESNGDYGYHGFTFTVSPAVPVSATLHVIKLIVNGNGGTAVPSGFNVHVKNSGTDVLGSPLAGVAAPGTSYSLPVGTYAVSEDANSSYAQSFSGDCDSSGNITLASGDDKICTMINTDIPPPPPLLSAPASGGGGVRYVPVIGILNVPTPLALPAGPGPVTYNYAVWNVGGAQALTNISVTDDKCSPAILLSGDTNGNGKLDPGENWKYSCTATLAATMTNTAIATGYSDDGTNQAAVATAIATVVVGSVPGFPDTGLVPPPLINIVKVPSRLIPFPFGGGEVMYAYTVTNPGAVSMHNVSVADDKCAPVYRTSGDANVNNLLDPGESWVYACRTNISVSTRNTATARGDANGITALGYAFSTVLVSAPGLPSTGAPLISASVPQIKTITINLQQGSSGSDVTALQQFLILQNKGSAAKALSEAGATGYFGTLTRAALAEFQAQAGISPALGNFGPLTRAYLSAHY